MSETFKLLNCGPCVELTREKAESLRYALDAWLHDGGRDSELPDAEELKPKESA